MSEPRNVTDARMLHSGRSIQHLANALSLAIFGHLFTSMSISEQAALLIVASRAYEVCNEQGWEFVFDSEGAYKYVVT